MSILKHKDLHFPLNNESLSKLRGHIMSYSGFQGTAATGNIVLLKNGQPVITQAGKIQDAYVMCPVAPGASEQIVVDLKKSSDGGATWATVLTATKTISTAAQAKVQVKLSVDPAKRSLAAGDMLRAEYTYTAGTPTPMVNNSTTVEIS